MNFSHIKFSRNFYILITLFSFSIKFLLMPISAHSDFLAINMFPALMREGILDIYSYIQSSNNPKIYYYHPIVYFFIGFFQFFYSFFSDTFLSWMRDLRFTYLNNITSKSTDYFIYTNNTGLFKDLFIMKVPYLIFDMLSLMLIYRFIKLKLISKGNIILWLFNPILIYSAYIFGQFDAITCFFVFLGYIYLYKKKIYQASLIWGIAGAFKIYPFIFVLPMALIYAKTIKNFFVILTISLLPFVIFLIPSLISNPELAIYSSTIGNYNLYSRKISGWEYYSSLIKLSIFVLSYLGLLIFTKLLKIKDKWRFTLGIGLISISMLLVLFPRAHFHYLLWVSPLIMLWFKQAKISSTIIILLTLSFASYKILANQLQLGLFAPINPEYFSSLPTFNEVVNRFIPYRIISTIGFIAFSLISLWIVVKVIRELLFEEKIATSNRK